MMLAKRTQTATLVTMAMLSIGIVLAVRGGSGGAGHPVYAAQAPYGADGNFALPDKKLTPGAVDPLAVADLSGRPHRVKGIERNVCAKDFRTGPIRAGIRNFAGLKKKACAEYGTARCDKSVEGDHLISLEIGGCPDCLTNLWPQPMEEARVKDRQVEDRLPKLVCAGKLTLAEAQKCIAGDWVACGKKVTMLRGDEGTAR